MNDRTPDPFRWEIVQRAIAGVVRGTDVPRILKPTVDVRPVSPADHAVYGTEKAAAFRDEKTLAAILRRLAAVAQGVVPERDVPTPARFFAQMPTRIICTDLAVDTFLLGQLLERAELANAIAEAAEAQW